MPRSQHTLPPPHQMCLFAGINISGTNAEVKDFLKRHDLEQVLKVFDKGRFTVVE